MPNICITGTGYFGSSRQRVKHLSRTLNIQYSGDLVHGVTTILVVADDPSILQSELLAGQKAKTAALWGNVAIVSNQWLEDSAQQGTLCDTTHYKLVRQKVLPMTGTESATNRNEQVPHLQRKIEAAEADALAAGPLTFADSPEGLRTDNCSAQFGKLRDLCDPGSPTLSSTFTSRRPSQLQHDAAFSQAEHSSVLYTGVSSGNAQAHQLPEAGASELSRDIGSSSLQPQPLQLLGNGDRSESAATAKALAGDTTFEPSPQAVRVRARHKLKRPPRQSTAARFHGVPASSIAYYDTLTVEHPELDAPLQFSIHDPNHCALVHYEDSMDGQTRDLAYARLLHCYRLAKDDKLYIEHLYLYDADDMRQQRAGSALLEQHSMADLELVHSSEVYHSLAEVIDGEFWLVDRATAEQAQEEADDVGAGRGGLCLFCEHSWDRLTGSLLSLVT